jgi:hypothetical protein
LGICKIHQKKSASANYTKAYTYSFTLRKTFAPLAVKKKLNRKERKGKPRKGRKGKYTKAYPYSLLCEKLCALCGEKNEPQGT